MKCGFCSEEVDYCDECGVEFEVGEKVFCMDFDKPKCRGCYVPAADGVVEA